MKEAFSCRRFVSIRSFAFYLSIFFLFFNLISCEDIYGQTPVQTQRPAQALTLATLEQIALANHPTIQAYEQKINAQNGYWVQAGLGVNPEIAYDAEEMSSHAPGGRQVVSLSQEVLGGSQLYHAQSVVAQQINIARQELEIAKLRVLTDVRIAVYEYLSVQNKLLHLREIFQRDEELAKQVEKSFQNGNASKLDWVNTRITARKSEQQYLGVRNDLNAAWECLACLIGEPKKSPCFIQVDLEKIPPQRTWEYYSHLLLTSSPEIARAEARVLEARRKVDYENAKNSTNFTFSGNLAYNTEESVMEGGVGVSIPLRFRDRNQGNISAACSELMQAQKEHERIVLGIQHRLAEIYAQYTNAQKDLQIYREALLPDAEEALTLAQTAYKNQETSMLDLATAQKTFLETNIEYYDALCAYWTSLTKLDGCLLTGGLEDSSL